MADTKSNLTKLGAAQLRARATWSVKRNGPLPEPRKLAALEFAAYLSQTNRGRRKTVSGVAADVVEIFTAAHDCALSSRNCLRAAEPLEGVLKAYGAILTNPQEGALEILFCFGTVGFLCAPDLDTEEMDIAGLKLAAQLAREGRGCLSSEIAEDAAALMRAAVAAKKGSRSAYERARAVGRKYGLLVFRPEDFPSVAVDSRCWSGGSFLVA